MTQAIQVLIVLALAGFIVVVVYMISALRSAKRLINETSVSISTLSRNVDESLNQITRDIKEFKEKATETLDAIDQTTNQLTNIAGNLDRRIDSFLNVFDPFKELIGIVYEQIAPPILKTSMLVSALSKGVSVFSHFLSKK